MKTLAIRFLPILVLIALISCDNSNRTETDGRAEQKIILSDETINDAVENELALNNEVLSHLIDVETANGIVKLKGSTDNLLARIRAREIASAVKGVRGVINQIEVKPVEISDEKLLERLRQAFYYNDVVDDYQVEYSVENGVVELSGMVDSWQEMQLAKLNAQSVSGVRKVVNNLNYQFDRDGLRANEEIKVEVVNALHHNVYVDDKMVNVDVDDQQVKLTGTVGSLAEKSQAINLAWVKGVDTVVADGLEINYWERNDMLRGNKYVEKTDKQIKSAVQASLLHDERINEPDIKVEVDNGNVTLKGSVDNLNESINAESDAKNVVGVKFIENKLKVRPDAVPNDNVLADNVREAINLNPYLTKYNIRTNTINSKVYLYGLVNSFMERNEAGNIASKVPGVVDIENNIEVNDYATMPYTYGYHTPSVPVIEKPNIKSDDKIKEDIEEQFWWSPFVNEDEIQVEVAHGHVELNGEVDSKIEKTYAEKNAMEGGAFTIENNIVVNNDI